jgi:hypothetical protein
MCLLLVWACNDDPVRNPETIPESLRQLCVRTASEPEATQESIIDRFVSFLIEKPGRVMCQG